MPPDPIAAAIVVVAASPLVAAGLRSALADAGVAGPAITLDDVRGLAAASASGAPRLVIAAARDAREAQAWWGELAGQVPLVLLGDRSDGPAPAGPQPCARLPAQASPAQLGAAIGAVLAGLDAWAPEPNGGADRSGRRAGRLEPEPPGEPLTPRELQVFELLAKGLSNRDVAAALGISAHTAKFHVGQILAKVGAATRAEAVAIGLKLGLIGL